MSISESWNYLWTLRDPRTEGWGYSENPRFILPLLGLYLLTVKVWGPKFMENRKPYDLKPYILTYNAFMVLINMYFFWNYFTRSYGGGGYSVWCQGVSFSTDKNSMEILNLTWWYVLVRILDFIDTIFFLLRKKYNHISLLHVVHHTLVVFSGWIWLTFGCDGQVMLGICMNSMIHVIMYSYYGIAALGPWTQKYLWWKKYLTKLQIFQFLVLTTHISIPLFYDCGYPKLLIYLASGQGLLGLALFVDFYIKRYCGKPEASETIRSLPCGPIPSDRPVDESRKNA